jgi:anti-sigma factor RsiW
MTDPTQRATTTGGADGSDERLGAYHDGELKGFARWRFERRLRRSPELQRELAALARVGDWVRAGHQEAPNPDLWENIAMRLPAADARRREPEARSRPFGLGWLALPGAVAATAVVAFAFAMGWFEPEAPATGGVVRWLDSGGRDVMVLEGAPDTTIIWVIDGAGPEALRGGKRESV